MRGVLYGVVFVYGGSGLVSLLRCWVGVRNRVVLGCMRVLQCLCLSFVGL